MTTASGRPTQPRRACWLVAAALLVLPAGGRALAGGLAFLDRQQGGVGSVGTGLNGVRAVALSPDGMHLYAASEKDNAVSVFQRDALTGMLVYSSRVRDGEDGVDGLDRVRAVAVSPEGLNVYAAGERDDAIAVFARDPLSGGLTFVEIQRDGIGGVDGLDGARAVIVSPDGAHVYAASSQDNAVAVFARDFDTGRLTFVEQQRDGVGAVHGLGGAEALAFGPDGFTLYVAASSDNSVTAFTRNPLSGALTVADRQRDNTNGVDGLDGVRTIALSPDGMNLYAGGKLDDAVAVFAADPGSGVLTFLERLRDNADGVDGLDGIEALAVSPDGATVYAVAAVDEAIAVFDRDLGMGTLTYRYTVRDGAGTVTGLVGPKAVIVSPDGAQVYVAAADTDSVLAFSGRCGDGFLDAGEQCDDGNTVGGDGCSPTCRFTCASAADCDDGDPCTEEHCRLGECVSAHCGSAGAVCELTSTLPAVQTADVCTPLPRPLNRLLRQKLREARRNVQRLRHRRASASARLMKTIDHTLSSVQRDVARLEAAGTITSDCRASVQHTIDALTSGLHDALLRSGLCAG